MAECSYARCLQERRLIKRELMKWSKDMLHIVGKFIRIYILKQFCKKFNLQSYSLFVIQSLLWDLLSVLSKKTSIIDISNR